MRKLFFYIAWCIGWLSAFSADTASPRVKGLAVIALIVGTFVFVARTPRLEDDVD